MCVCVHASKSFNCNGGMYVRCCIWNKVFTQRLCAATASHCFLHREQTLSNVVHSSAVVVTLHAFLLNFVDIDFLMLPRTCY